MSVLKILKRLNISFKNQQLQTMQNAYKIKNWVIKKVLKNSQKDVILSTRSLTALITLVAIY